MPERDAPDALKKGFLLACRITRENAKTFYFASKLLAAEKRAAAYSIYAICRLSDEAVDSAPLAQEERLLEIEKNIDLAYSAGKPLDPLLSAFHKSVERYKIPAEYFAELLRGMRLDLKKNHYANFNELYEYCYKVAGVVGLIMLKILGSNDSRAQDYAIDLGIAMQLTNILRDIKEDLMRGRIYLPKDEMRRFGVSEDSLREEKVDTNFRDFMRFQIERAGAYYANSRKGIKFIREPDSRLLVRVMENLYSGILESIEKNDYDIFSQRAYLSMPRKVIRTLKIMLRERNK